MEGEEESGRRSCVVCEEGLTTTTTPTTPSLSHPGDVALGGWGGEGEELGVVWVLTGLLDLPPPLLTTFLAAKGEPSSWGIALCPPCTNTYLLPAKRLVEQAAKLNRSLATLKEQAKHKIANTNTGGAAPQDQNQDGDVRGQVRKWVQQQCKSNETVSTSSSAGPIPSSSKAGLESQIGLGGGVVGVPDAKKAAAEAALKRNVRLGEGKKKPNFGLKGILGQRREEAFLKIAKDSTKDREVKAMGLSPPSDGNQLSPSSSGEGGPKGHENGESTGILVDNEKCINPDTLSVRKLYYNCSLIDTKRYDKDTMANKIKEFLLAQLTQDEATYSAQIIHTCNKDKELVAKCVDLLCKSCDNILNDPYNEKYWTIKVTAKPYESCIQKVVGGDLALIAAGFGKQKIMSSRWDWDETQMEEEIEAWVYLDLPDYATRLIKLRDKLRSTEPIVPELERDVQVLSPQEALKRDQVPHEFYGENGKLLYIVVRIRFPDPDDILQGTFSTGEKLSSVYSFVIDNLMCEPPPFDFFLESKSLSDEGDKSLGDLGLGPITLLEFRPQGSANGMIFYCKAKFPD